MVDEARSFEPEMLELVIFAVATAALAEVGQAVAAAVFAVAATGTALLSRPFPGRRP